MNKLLLTLLCSGSLMTLSGCGQKEEATATQEAQTEVAVNDAAPVAQEETKTAATEINVDSAVVVEEKSAATEAPVSAEQKQQDEKF